MNDKQKLMIGVVAALVVVGIFFVLSQSGSGPEEAEPVVPDTKVVVALSASTDKSTYTSGEEIRLTLNLENSGTADVCLSDMTTGNIQFASLTRDGEPVETRSAPSFFLIPFSDILASRLMPVSSGESMELELSSSQDAGLGALTFDTTIPEDTSGTATFYNVEEPGVYALELMYEYAGAPSSDCANVFTGPTNPVSITFTVSE